MIQTSPGFFPRGLHESWPALGPLKYFLLGYFCGTRTPSSLKMYSSSLVNQFIDSYRPENRLEQCRPCSKCQMILFLILRLNFRKTGYRGVSNGTISP